MDLAEILTKWVPILILVIGGLIIIINIIDQITSGGFSRGLVCTLLFWIPWGSLYSIMTQGCNVIPA